MLAVPLIWTVRVYQVTISPLFAPQCKYFPSCSVYSIQAFEKYGLKGIIHSVKRISRCHPFAKGGYDPLR
ncbi:MAG: membrane protein insertion efficiency factor YidD [candidate division Zixibacteria bacterium]|nr:membrane protein insertion efficiency factor YidD [candidate division Zixibacteria bacterium]